MTIIENETITRGQADNAEFRTQLLEHVPQLRAFARGLSGSRDRADDLVQDTMARALGAAHRYQPGTNMRAWLFTILRNCHFSECRKARYDGGSLDDLPERLQTTRGDQMVSLELKEVRALLQLVPVQYREALILVSAAGMSYEEAAAVCKCAVGTIKSRINRAPTELTRLVDEPVAPSRRLAVQTPRPAVELRTTA
ncbi:MAG: sigma-70 family RNA polymerase sigma factor [Alphaproteobacteria bacterium]|nr:sigma-70 family RNA polymerase sigma factor [Alphaproteobacteria bacterium]